jgi:hypothetical protein
MPQPPDTAEINAFIARWERFAGAEMQHSQSFLNDLCVLLRVPRPHDGDLGYDDRAYAFERGVSGAADTGGGPARIDLYRRGHFILESKQGSWPAPGRVVDEATLPQLLDVEPATGGRKKKVGHGARGTSGWYAAMDAARLQARSYAGKLEDSEPHVPFLIVVDVGYCIDLYANFSPHNRHWLPFPSPGQERIYLRDLHDAAKVERLRAIWLEPYSLNPSDRRIAVTRDLASSLARVATELEAAGHHPTQVSEFLSRCLFAMFAEDVGLLPEDGFLKLLKDARATRPRLRPALFESAFAELDRGGWSANFKDEILQFNGKLFADCRAFPLTETQLDLLIEAAGMDWSQVEPAIFGTLLERALDPKERHKLGAHYTPRSYVERLVAHTLMDPLRAEWDDVLARAIQEVEAGKPAAAGKVLRTFHTSLCRLRILDPACGSGNFLYVALEMLKALEGEVLQQLGELAGQRQEGLALVDVRVNPSQFLGIEKSQRAATTADLVLWIGYLQWQIRNSGVGGVPQPVLHAYHNIECRDAVISFTEERLRLDDQGKPVFRWGGKKILDKSTGAEVPDPADMIPVLEPVNPQPSPWPDADYIIGNPPFLGNWKMRQELGDGYTEALRALYPDVQESVDFVMYWWERAAGLVSAGRLRRFGLITTNSITQVFARRVLQRHMQPAEGFRAVRLAYAIPDHPWVDATLGADVRIAMTVGDAEPGPGLLERVVNEVARENGEHEVDLESVVGTINADLKAGVDLTLAKALRANYGVCSPGVKLHGAGFIVSPEKAAELGLGTVPGLEQYIVPYRNGRDITQRSRGVLVIDLFGLTAEEVRRRFPAAYQHVLTHVKPERDRNNAPERKERWWLFGRSNDVLRGFLVGLPRYIATVETSKERFFVLLDASIRPDNMLVNIGVGEPWILGALSSRWHVAWALRAGGTLEDRPRYNKTRCFDTFPFPEPSLAQAARIGDLAEQIDALRKERQNGHPDLQLTKVYSTLEKLRAGEELTVKEQQVRDQGTVLTLLELHRELDAAVADAYGWPADITDDDALARLLALNQARAAEEAAGVVRWLRPDYQIPRFGSPSEQQQVLLAQEESTPDATAGAAAAHETAPVRRSRRTAAASSVGGYSPLRQPWPTRMGDQLRAVRQVLERLAGEGKVTPERVAAHFAGAPLELVREILEGLG